MMFSKINISMFVFGLIIWASLLSFVEAMRIPTDSSSIKRVRWGVNQERLYRLPNGLTSRDLSLSASKSEDLLSNDECKCGRCGACRTKKMMGEGDGSEERLFGFGSPFSSYYDSYSPSMGGMGPYSNYDPFYHQQYYEPYGVDSYYGQYGHGQQYQYPTQYW